MWRSWLARQIVALKAGGSNPLIHPIFLMCPLLERGACALFRRRAAILGCRQAVRHQTLTLAFAGSNPASPAKYDSLAQLVEQRPFKAKVRGSSPRRVTKKQHRLLPVLFFHAVGREPRRGEIGIRRCHISRPNRQRRLLGPRCPRRVTARLCRNREAPALSPKESLRFLFIPAKISAIITSEEHSREVSL